MRIALLVLALIVTSAANAATLTLPSFTIVNPPVVSQTPVCTIVSPLPNAPVAVGTVLWNCTVAPSNWTGTATLSGSNTLTIPPNSGNTFTVQVGPNPLTAGNYVPGTITTTP